MLGLAEFVMRGRWQAVLVAVPSAGTGLFFWVSAAVIALVTLRKGPGEGALIWLWALLPAAMMAWLRNPMPLGCLVIVFALATLLRNTRSWPLVLSVAAVGGGVLSMLLMNMDDYLQPFVAAYVKEVAELQENMAGLRENMGVPEPAAQEMVSPRLVDFAGLFGVGATLFACLGMFLGRYWQANLYNPGGFQQEFHALRLSPAMAVLLLGAMALCLASSSLKWCSGIFILPLFFAGLGLLHYLAATHHAGKGLLVFAYAMLMLVTPMVLLALVLVAVIDSLIDVRQRLGGTPPTV